MRSLKHPQLVDAVDDLRIAAIALEDAVDLEIAARQDRQRAILDFNKAIREVTETAQIILNKRVWRDPRVDAA